MRKGVLFMIGLLIVSCSLVSAKEEQRQTGVVIHSDPRLAVLLRTNHSYVSRTRPEPPRKVVRPAPDNPTQYRTYTGPSGIVHREYIKKYEGRGFRVQIYSGPSREKAIAIKTAFMRNHPGVSTYISYMAPNFRVKIGNYRNHSDAEGMLREANSISEGPSMIVPDVVKVD